MMTDEWTVWVAQSLQLLLGTVFLAAGVTKLKEPSQFVVALRNYELIPRALSGPVALVLVMIELFTAISFLTGWALEVGVPVATAFLLTLAVAVCINLRRGRVVPCGCFGSRGEQISGRTLGRIGLLLVAVIGLAGVRLSGAARPDVASPITEGMRSLEQFALTATFAALLLVLGSWLLHIPELTGVFRLRSNRR